MTRKERELIKGEKELIGWKAICDHIGFSKATAIKIAEEYNAPIIHIGHKVFTTEEKIDQWISHLFKTETYKKLKREDKNEDND